tara:strand:+ start:644 stop:1318 length:675 start_codon:yes stop_codon:yes gene_type:complete
MNKSFLNNIINKVTFYFAIILSIIVLLIMINKLNVKVNKVLQWPILYYHLPLAINTFFGCLMLSICSFLFLFTNNYKWDLRAKVFAEVGAIFCLLVLITGSIWGKLNWGVFWSWEPRLVSTFILFIIYIVYFMLRKFSGYYERSSRLAAVIGVIILVDIPIIYYAVDMWAPEVQLHPQRTIRESDETVTWILPIATAAFFTVFIALFLYRLFVEEILNDKDINE